ncbi:Acyltransferase family protein associated with ethylmalonyl-CoA pathway [hydrothermal vent metagenome]|uniref:Acyltransferase family protein associated with ethylmalonyl-CoA pathway n=1 Tax=hydrothermal vent metagenome TaxID=652676 RepID=A0A3B0WWG5_9ZZZZ
METIALPYWIFVVLLIFSAVMVLDRILLPSMRWYLKRRVNRVIKEINTRLDIEIRPIQFTRRQAIIDQLVFDEKVLDAIKLYAEENKMPHAIAQAKARKYAAEIVPAFNAYIYFRLGYWLAKKLAQLIYRVRVGFYDKNKISEIDSNASVVFVMNHRSNMDYVLVSFLAAEKTTLSYAVGEWARVWPLQMLIKAMGAFFVRRNSGNPLYRKVLERYINISTRAGVCQAVFLEGGLTKDGALREPRLGFLDYMLRDYHPHSDKDIVFIPVGINYDRVIEDRSLIRRLDKSAKRRSLWFVIKTTFTFIFKNAMLSRKNRWRRFGYASVNFGEPISAKQYCKVNNVDFSALQTKDRFVCVETLAKSVMHNISQVVPIVPVALMSAVLKSSENNWKSELELKSLCSEKINQLAKSGAPIDISHSALESVLGSALDALIGRGLVEEKNNLYRMQKSETDILNYYANSIIHWQQK